MTTTVAVGIRTQRSIPASRSVKSIEINMIAASAQSNEPHVVGYSARVVAGRTARIAGESDVCVECRVLRRKRKEVQSGKGAMHSRKWCRNL